MQTRMSRKRRNSDPLDRSALEELALSYLARFATSSAKLEAYLVRKIRERGIADGAEPLDVQGLVDRMVELRYVDDAAFARARAGGMLRKGYGARRVDQALRVAGIDDDLRLDILPDESSVRRSALILARKKGFGPFGRAGDNGEHPGRAIREKQIAAMIRAGHGFETARAVIDASSVDEVERWAGDVEERDE